MNKTQITHTANTEGKKEPAVYYNINHVDQSLVPVIPDTVSKLNTESIWNEILCGCVGTTVSGGGPSRSMTFPYKAEQQSNSLADKSEEVVVSVGRLQLAEDEIAVYRILYNTSPSYKTESQGLVKTRTCYLFITNKN